MARCDLLLRHGGATRRSSTADVTLAPWRQPGRAPSSAAARDLLADGLQRRRSGCRPSPSPSPNAPAWRCRAPRPSSRTSRSTATCPGRCASCGSCSCGWTRRLGLGLCGPPRGRPNVALGRRDDLARSMAPPSADPLDAPGEVGVGGEPEGDVGRRPTGIRVSGRSRSARAIARRRGRAPAGATAAAGPGRRVRCRRAPRRRPGRCTSARSAPAATGTWAASATSSTRRALAVTLSRVWLPATVVTATTWRLGRASASSRAMASS